MRHGHRAFLSRVVISLVAMQWASVLAIASTVSIDFAVFPDGAPIPNETFISDQFAPLGVGFVELFPNSPRVLTALGGILISGGPNGFYDDIEMTFSVPVRSITIEIVGSGLNIAARLEGFDAAGASLGVATHEYNGNTGVLSAFTFAAPSGQTIARARYNGGLHSSAASIGTLRFDTAQTTVGENAVRLASEVANVGTHYLVGGKGWDWHEATYALSSVVLSGDPSINDGYWYYYGNGTNGDPANVCDYSDDPGHYNEHAYCEGLDCSGLVKWAYNHGNGANRQWDQDNPILYEGVSAQYCWNSLPLDAVSQLEPGDLVFIHHEDPAVKDRTDCAAPLPQPHAPGDPQIACHVGLYAGNGEVIEAPSPGHEIKRTLLSTFKTYHCDGPFTAHWSYARQRSRAELRTKIKTNSPIALSVTDPDGVQISDQTVVDTRTERLREAANVLYYAQDQDPITGEVDDMVLSPLLKAGVYRVNPIPKPGTSLDSVYSVQFETATEVLVLADHVPISEIPPDGYRVTSTGDAVFLNTPPVASAGPAQVLECGGNRETTGVLDGRASTDADSTPGTNDDLVRFDWTEDGSPIGSGQQVSSPFNLGVHEISLTVGDRAGAEDDESVTITVHDTMPPTIACPSRVVVECQAGGQAEVALTPAIAADSCYGAVAITNSQTAGGAEASGSYSLGSTPVTFTATDDSGNVATCQTIVTVVDTTAPVVTVDAAPNHLWPPNHKMYGVHNDVLVGDACDPSPGLVLESVVSSEADDAAGGGDGNTNNDIQDASLGMADFDVLLRAERQGGGQGRTYAIQYQATDASGNIGTGTDTVKVPHDQDGIEEPISVDLDGSDLSGLSWEPVYQAQHFDVIRGNLDLLRVEASDVDLGPVACLGRGFPGGSTVGPEDPELPGPGKVFFYLVQFHDGTKENSEGELFLVEI